MSVLRGPSVLAAVRAAGARLASSLRALAGSRHDDDGLREELESHLAMHIEENIRRGMSPETARREALLAAGGLTLAVEAAHERRGLPVVEHLVGDVRYAIRTLRSKPAYTIAVVLTFALGIGANSAMFSIVNAVVLRPLPYPRPDEIVSLSIRNRGEDLEVVDDRDYFAWRDASRTVTLAAYSAVEGVVAGSAAGPQAVRGMEITADYFSIFGVRPLLGRAFTTDEYRSDDARVTMLGEALWRREFGADSSIVGRAIAVDGVPRTVVGIVPASFATARPVMFWTPDRLERPTDPHTTFFYFTVARLRDGVSLDEARAELGGISRRLHAGGSAAERSTTPVVMTLHERRLGGRRQPLLLLFAAVGVLLLIACANLANLALARAIGRHREIALRRALGASRWRISQGTLCESLVLSIGGAALGLFVAIASIRYIVHLSPESVGNIETIRLDASVLVFTLLVAAMTGIGVGIFPAVSAHGDLRAALANGGGRSAGSRGQQLARRVLVVAQLAAALVMLTGAGLVGRTFLHVVSIDPGFRADHLLDAEIRLPEPRYSQSSAAPFFTTLLTRVRHIPGVESAALTDAPPLMGGMTFSTADTSGRPSPQTTVVDVGPAYFRTIGATIRAGRDIDSTDRGGGPKVLVVNTALARRLFGDVNAVGRAIPIGRDTGRVIGVIDDVAQLGFEGAPSGAAYWPLAQEGIGTYLHAVVRTAGPFGPVETAMTHVIQSIDPTLAPPAYKPMGDVVAELIAPRKFTFVLLGVFAALAASLAVVGLYGVLAHLVANREREIAIRVALGADPRRVAQLVLGQGLAMAGLGVAIGVGASMFTVRTLRALVYGVSVHDPWTFGIGAVLLVLVSIAASYIPARRASRLDPVAALRAD